MDENYQEAFDIVYGMQMDEALDLLQESQNENLKGLVSDLQQLRKENVPTVTAACLSTASSLGLLD